VRERVDAIDGFKGAWSRVTSTRCYKAERETLFGAIKAS
jgi:hypothetical protein